MRRTFAGPTILAALAFVILAPFSAAWSDDLQLQELLDGFRDRYGFPGATAAYIRPDGSVEMAATGFSDLEDEIATTPRSRMLAASIGKSFVGATVLALESDGVLKRSDPVALHLGDRDWFERLPNHATMTVNDLLHHSSGLPDHVYSDDFAAEMAARVAAGGGAVPAEAAIGFVLDAAPLFPAGEGWAYSDTGYLLLGLVIEKAAGRSFYDLVADLFLDPLRLEATTPSDRRALPGLAAGYTIEGTFGLPRRTMDSQGRLLWDPASEWTGGGLVSNSPDLAAWGHALFGGAALPVPYLDRLLDGYGISPDAPGIAYGAGVSIQADTPHGPVYGHGGWLPGYVSSLRHYADHGVTVAFQINTDVGIVDDSTDLLSALESALAELAIRNSGE